MMMMVVMMIEAYIRYLLRQSCRNEYAFVHICLTTSSYSYDY